MVRALSDPSRMATYSVSDAVATYYLYESTCTRLSFLAIIPMGRKMCCVREVEHFVRCYSGASLSKEYYYSQQTDWMRQPAFTRALVGVKLVHWRQVECLESCTG
jgi:hypothetical protein